MKISTYVCLYVLAATPTVFAQATFTSLGSFSGSNGANPQCALTETQPGVFLGTTVLSLKSNNPTLFQTTGQGGIDSLTTMDGDTQGALPTGQLLQASNGYLYGATQGAGLSGGGSIFRTSLNGTVSVVSSDVTSPSSLVQSSDGYLYFTNYTSGGILTIAKLSLKGTETVYTFPSTAAQAGPLVQAQNGNLYGETQSIAPGHGTIYQLTLDGTFSTVYSFTGGTDGAQPLGGLIQASNGLLYGVTNSGGAFGSGTIFSISTAGEMKTLHAFSYLDGTNPLTSVIQASDGNIYGTNAGLASFGPGNVFRIGLDGSNYTTVFTFPAGSENFAQVSGPGVTQGSDGKLYGTTLLGGDFNQGQLYSLDLRLPAPTPAVSYFRPSSGSPGTYVLLAGQNLLGVSDVSFNGTSASTVYSRGVNFIVTRVPQDATTGPITITTQNGKTVSSDVFNVQ